MQCGSKIINLSSQSSFQPVPYLNLYASTKAFVTSYTRSLNVELKEKGISATAICAGWADTEMLPRTLNGKEVKYPGLVSPREVAVQGLNDSKRGKDMLSSLHHLKKIYRRKTNSTTRTSFCRLTFSNGNPWHICQCQISLN